MSAEFAILMSLAGNRQQKFTTFRTAEDGRGLRRSAKAPPRRQRIRAPISVRRRSRMTSYGNCGGRPPSKVHKTALVNRIRARGRARKVFEFEFEFEFDRRTPMRTRWGLAPALLAVACLPAAGQNASWPQFRGPGGTGVSSEKQLPAEWGAGKNLAWKV